MSCEIGVNGCSELAEFIPLGTLPQTQSYFSWVKLDRAGEHAVYSSSYSGGRTEVSSFLWSSDAGLIRIGGDLPVPDPHSEVDEPQLAVSEVASGAVALAGWVYLEEHAGPFYWTREGGVRMLDLESWAMTSDGSAVAGLHGGKAVWWTDASGTQEILPGDSVQTNVLAAGSAAVFVDGGTRLMHFTPSSGVSEVDLPIDAAVGAGVSAAAVSDDGNVIVGSIANPLEGKRLFIWTRGRGARWLGEVATSPPATAYSRVMLSGDGRAVIGSVSGSVGALNGYERQTFRWTSESGMQILSAAPQLHPTYLSASGDVVVGYRYVGDEAANGARWSAAEGLTAPSEPLPWTAIALGGDLLVSTAQGELRVQKFEAALGAGELPIDRLGTRLVPEGWSAPSLQAISENARMLAGSAVNPGGERQAWLVRLREVCEAER